MKRKINGKLSRFHIAVPEIYPRFYQTTYFASRPLPLTTQKPSVATGLTPSGGKANANTYSLSRVSHGGVDVVKTAGGPTRNRWSNRKTTRKGSKKRTTSAVPKTKITTKTNGLLLKKKKVTFRKLVRSGTKAVSKFIRGNGGHHKLRNSNGRFKSKGG